MNLKRTIVLSLGQIQSQEAFRTIVDLFSVRDEALQVAVVESLGSYRNYQSMFELFRLMKSGQNVSLQVRMNAMIFLTRLVGKKMTPFLLEALEDKDPRIQANAVESIALLKDRKTIPILFPYLRHENHRIRANTVIALYPFRFTRKKALETLEELYHSQLPVARLAALYAIGALRLKKYEGELLGMLKGADKKMLQHASAALAKMKNRRFCETFVRLLLDPDEAFALETARHLGQIPRYSRMIVFETVAKLPPEERNLLFARLDKTPLDFSAEKAMIFTEEPVPAHLPL